MLKGGYKIIDLKDTNLTTAQAKTIKGIHEDIENSYRKAILLSGIVLEGVEKNDVFVEVSNSSGTYTITVYGKTITITSEDLVSLA